MTVCVYLLWSWLLIAAQSNKEHCYCSHTHMVYTKVNGAVVDSVDMRKKIYDLKRRDNSEKKSLEIEYYFYIMKNKQCYGN